MNELINTIVKDTGADTYQVYLTASNDTTAFRKIIYPDYKGNRKASRPTHYQAMREFLVTEHGASVSTTIEADDALGIALTDNNNNGVACTLVSIDKDLLQVPGLHYNFVKKEFTTVTPYDGLRFFYKQCLIGDKADNIKGVDGIGEVKAERLLKAAEETARDLYSAFDEPTLSDYEQAWFNTVQNAYEDDIEFFKNGACLWMLTQPYPLGSFNYHHLGKTLIPEMESEE